jgi:excisionase family DNA binding protein
MAETTNHATPPAKVGTPSRGRGQLLTSGSGSHGDRLPDRLLDVTEAAALLAVKPATLYQWAYQRRIPVVKLFGPRGALRFRESDIRALIARSVRPALSGSDDRGLDPQ